MRTGLALTAAVAALVGAADGEPNAPLAGRTIVIDPGHNGGNARNAHRIARLVDAGTHRKACDTVGARTARGYPEHAHNLDVALRLGAILRRAGARIVLTRTSDTGWGPCITRRAAIGNDVRADAAISIHADGGPTSGRGFHVIHPARIRGLTDDIAADSHRLALAIRGAYRAGTRTPYATYTGRAGLSRRADLGGLNLSDVPKVFLEAGNMRNATDARLLSNPAFRQREANAISSGLAAFLRRRS